MSTTPAKARTVSRPRAAAPWPVAGRHARSIALFLSFAMGVLAVDLASKYLAFEYVAGQPVELSRERVDEGPIIPYHEGIVIVPSVLQLKLTVNRGAVFGMGQGNQAFFAIVSVLAVGVIGWVFCLSRANAWVQHVALALVLAGALGNLYDRIVYSGVRDMLYLFPGVRLPFGWQWSSQSDEVFPWIFNVADVSLLVGVSTLLLLSWFSGEPRESAAKSTRR